MYSKHQQTKNKLSECEKILANEMINRGSYTKYITSFMSYNSVKKKKKGKQPGWKWVEDLNRYILQKINRWSTGILKDTQHHYSSDTENVVTMEKEYGGSSKI